MPRRVEDLASRVEELEGEYERLLDEYVEVRQRLDYVESCVDHPDGPGDVDVDVESDLGSDVSRNSDPCSDRDPEAHTDTDTQTDPDRHHDSHSDPETRLGNGANGSDSEEASPEDIDEAVQEVAEDSEGNGVENHGQDDIIIA